MDIGSTGNILAGAGGTPGGALNHHIIIQTDGTGIIGNVLVIDICCITAQRQQHHGSIVIGVASGAAGVQHNAYPVSGVFQQLDNTGVGGNRQIVTQTAIIHRAGYVQYENGVRRNRG